MTKLIHHGIDLTAPGGLASLFAFNRARYGDLRMMADPPAPPEPPADPAGTGDDKKFSQADLDRIITDRLQRARPADYDDLKTKAEKLDAIEAANASETDKAVTKARNEAAAEVRTELMAERVLDKVEIAAAGTWADALDARLRLQSRAKEFISKDGSIDTAAIKTAVEAELKKAPHLAAASTTRRPAPDPGQGNPPNGNAKGAGGMAEAVKRGFIKKT
jgi:hypothetical protein